MATQQKKKQRTRNSFVGAFLRAIAPLRTNNGGQKRLPPISDAYDYTGGSYPYVTPLKTTSSAAKTKRTCDVIDADKTENCENRCSNLSCFDDSKYLTSPVEIADDVRKANCCSLYDQPLLIEDFQRRIEHLTELEATKSVEMSGNRAFFRVNRRNAELMLLRPNVRVGTYLLRPSSTNNDDVIVISVRSLSISNESAVIHIKINLMNDGHCFSVSGETFPDINTFLSFYSENSISFDGKPSVCLAISYPRNFQEIRIGDISIPRSQVEFLEQIGAGNFGEVFRGKWRSLDVAVKSLKQTDGLKTSQQSAILDEAKTMAAVLHENLVKLIAVSVDQEPFLIITEFMNLGSLLDFMLNNGGSFLFSFHDLVDILKQIACGMAYLEAEKFLHRDLRAANCLVHQESPNGPLDLKIADFGLSAVLDQDNTYESHSDKQVPVRWTAPEALLYKRFSNKSDVWSFGILAFEVFSLGALPYEGKNNFELWRFIDTGGRISLQDLHAIQKDVSYLARTLENEENMLCPEEIYSNLMANCWRKEPCDRPTFQSLVSFIIDYENNHD